MTCVVAITDGHRLVFAADSAATNLQTGEIYNLENEKIFFCGPWLVGHTTSYRLGQVLRHQVDWPIPPPELADLEGFITTQVMDVVRKALGKAGARRRKQNAEFGGAFLLGLRGRIFAVADDFSVVRLKAPFAAIGHGRFLAYGALHALQDRTTDLEEICRIALEAAEGYDPTVRRPFNYLTA